MKEKIASVYLYIICHHINGTKKKSDELLKQLWSLATRKPRNSFILLPFKIKSSQS